MVIIRTNIKYSSLLTLSGKQLPKAILVSLQLILIICMEILKQGNNQHSLAVTYDKKRILMRKREQLRKELMKRVDENISTA